jgi:CRISPR-associated protein Cas1
MKRHLNTVFVTTPGAYLAKEGEAVVVKHEGSTALRVPLHMLGGIVCFGGVGMSPPLMGKCAESGVTVSFVTETGRYVASVHGFTLGNVLLRREQYRWADDPRRSALVARALVAAKIANARTVLRRATRDYPDAPERAKVEAAANRLAAIVRQVEGCEDLDLVRGLEGESAAIYFQVFGALIVPAQQQAFPFNGRNRRPPLDPVNALLSFLYAILAHDARAACECAGLDGAVGFLHRDRSGRPGLALDLMEEFRPFLADRLVLSLINRQQVDVSGFRTSEAGAVEMDDKTRKVVLTAYQQRKQEEITHPFLGEPTTVGLLVHLQARLLARFIRGDLDAYPAFVWR